MKRQNKIYLIALILILVGNSIVFGTAAFISLKLNKKMAQSDPTEIIPDQATSTDSGAYPLSPSEVVAVQKAIDDYLPGQLLSLVWKNLFSYRTNFESLSGFSVSTSAGGGSVTLNSDNVNLTTGSTSTNFAELAKDWLDIGIPTFSQPSNFRTSFSFTATPANLTAYIVVGSVQSTGTSYYGFKVVNGTLYGVSSNNGTGAEKTVSLVTGLTDDIYGIEARYIPSKGITFYVGVPGGALADSQSPRGTLTSNLPSPALAVNQSIMDVKIITNTSLAKSLTISYFDYLQVISQSRNN